MTSCRWQGPSQSLPCLVALPYLEGIGMHQPQWSQTQELKVMASDLSAQEHGATAQGFEGDTSEQGDLPLPVPHSIEANIPTWMAPMCVNISDSQWVYCCSAKGCCEWSSSSPATICVHVCCAHLGMKLSCPFYPVVFFLFQYPQVTWQVGTSNYLFMP